MSAQLSNQSLLSLLVVVLTLTVTASGNELDGEFNRVSRNEIWPKIKNRISGKTLISRPSILIAFVMMLSCLVLAMLGVELMFRMESREAYRSLILEYNVDIYGHLKP